MTTIKHPTLKGHTREVRERDVDEWLAAGWLAVVGYPADGDGPSDHLEAWTSEQASVEVVSTEAPKDSPKRQPRKG